MERTQAEKILFQRFGIRHFYDEQWIAVSKLLNGERILMIQRTGFGKSLCFQFPATLFDGVTIVFSPLIALMRDQVKSLKAKGIAAGYINSEQTFEENEATITQALEGKLKILYIAPERQENERWLQAAKQMNISMVVIDEAHTISTWGHDFRPSFRRIINLVKQLPEYLPVLATTATATLRVQHDIEAQIRGRLTTLRGSLARDNFRMFVVRLASNEEKMLWLAKYIQRIPGNGLIYAGTRVEAEQFSKWLKFVGVNAIEYHAGLDGDTRKEIERGLMSNRWKCIVSTNALGMGMNKPDVRFVIHTQMPQSPINYYQEIGRAGRDGLPTNIILLFNESKLPGDNVYEDMRLPIAFIESARPAIKKYHDVIELLKKEPLGERELIKKANLKSNQVRIIKADLISQGIAIEVKYSGLRKLEYRYDSPELNTAEFEELRNLRLQELDRMTEYVFTTRPRMEYLCSFLDSAEYCKPHNCDNTDLPPCNLGEVDESLTQKMQLFKESVFPVLEVADKTSCTLTNPDGSKTSLGLCLPGRDVIEVYKNSTLTGTCTDIRYVVGLTSDELDCVKSLEQRHRVIKSRIVNGVAAAYYGDSAVGSIIHRCKYENGGDFPDYLLTLTLRAFYKHFAGQRFDMVMYVPPAVSGDLVRNFAEKFARAAKIPISHALLKRRDIKEQKLFQNSYNKQGNVANAFSLDSSAKVKDLHILVLDDIYDSGATLKEIGRMLTDAGARTITPIVIAKTIGGTL